MAKPATILTSNLRPDASLLSRGPSGGVTWRCKVSLDVRWPSSSSENADHFPRRSQICCLDRVHTVRTEHGRNGEKIFRAHWFRTIGAGTRGRFRALESTVESFLSREIHTIQHELGILGRHTSSPRTWGRHDTRPVGDFRCGRS
jgi:hypothetical protein